MKRVPYGLIIFIISIFAIAIPMISSGNLPGDDGDARINLYLLEHFYQNLISLKHSFTDADFLYPFPKTALFTDNYWGTALIYSYFRWSSLDPQTSFCGWFLIGFIVNYVASYIVARKLGLSELSASITAFIFTFSIPIISQSTHAQLLYRPYVPIAIFAAIKYLDKKSLLYLAISALMISLQFLTAGYNGMFLAIFIMILITCEAFRTKSIVKLLPSKDVPSATYFILLATIIILSLYALPYLLVKSIYNFNHSWGVTSLMIPRVLSYFTADLSYFWPSQDLKLFNQIPFRQEHQLFIGFGALTAILALIFSKKPLNDLTATRLSNATITTILLFLTLGNLTLYIIIVDLIPGLNQMRAVSRIILILLFPIGYLVGLSISRIENSKNKIISTKAIAYTICCLIMIDSITMQKLKTTKSSWDARLKNIESQITTKVDDSSILVVRSETGFCNLADVDAMMASQKLGIKTINGCSSSIPGRIIPLTSCENVDRRIKSIEEVMTKIIQQKYKFDKSKLIYVGFDKDCK